MDKQVAVIYVIHYVNIYTLYFQLYSVPHICTRGCKKKGGITKVLEQTPSRCCVTARAQLKTALCGNETVEAHPGTRGDIDIINPPHTGGGIPEYRENCSA